MIKLLLTDLFQYYSLLKFKITWRQANKHNNTVAVNKFDINQVMVGNYSYGELQVKTFGDRQHKLKIGSFVSIAQGTKFLLAGEHDYSRLTTFPIEKYVLKKSSAEPISKGDIVIGDDVWIGENAIVLSGVQIGQGAVIAAGSVVAKNVPPYSISINNTVLKYRFSDEVRQKLLKLDLERLQISDFEKINQFDTIEQFLDSSIYKKYSLDN
ncbi:TPA: CatB-related O-acetyltransferase [Streptococcus suis]|nr:CatB-related O-acetyltransferase [Streptococcus suis]